MAPTWLIASENIFPNTFVAVAYTLFIVVWVLAEVLNRLVSRKNSSGERKDHGSFYLIILQIIISIIGTVLLREYNIWTFTGNLQTAGLALGFFGIIFREYSIAVLGKSFTVKVEVDKKRELTKSGPYKYIRHPAYTGSLMTIVGFAIGLGTWAGTILVFSLSFISYAYRISVEEKALTERYGEEYREYKKRTWKLLPGY